MIRFVDLSFINRYPCFLYINMLFVFISLMYNTGAAKTL